MSKTVSLLSVLRDLGDLREINNFDIICSKEAENKIQETIENQNKLSNDNFIGLSNMLALASFISILF